jgi:hypothetical protein
MPKTTELLRDRTRRFRSWGLAIHSVCEATGRAGRIGFHVGRADNRSQERLLCLLGEAKRTW